MLTEDSSSLGSETISWRDTLIVSKSGIEWTYQTLRLTRIWCFKKSKVSVINSSKQLTVLFICSNYAILWALLTIGLSTIVPVFFWNESLWIAFFTNLFRHFINFTHIGFSNSFNHMFGKRPFDGTISATDNFFVNVWMFGEGNHNYHHTFPQDYKGAEFNGLRHFNLLATIILMFQMLGLAYDLKTASPEMITRRVLRTGDGSYVNTAQSKLQ